MYQFFVETEQINDKVITITGADVNHIKNVLRLKIGEEIAVRDGADYLEYRCSIEKFEEDKVICRLLFMKECGIELPSKVFLFQGLPKNDKMELIIQKAVELGVYQIIPLATKRAVVKLDAKKESNKLARWNAIAESAAKQSKRMIIPEVIGVKTVKEALEYCKEFDVKIIPYELADSGGMSITKSIIEKMQPNQTIAILIGPEGGFEEGEVALATAHGFCPITLGHRILRTETAGFTVLSWIMYQLEM